MGGAVAGLAPPVFGGAEVSGVPRPYPPSMKLKIAASAWDRVVKRCRSSPSHSQVPKKASVIASPMKPIERTGSRSGRGAARG